MLSLIEKQSLIEKALYLGIDISQLVIDDYIEDLEQGEFALKSIIQGVQISDFINLKTHKLDFGGYQSLIAEVIEKELDVSECFLYKRSPEELAYLINCLKTQQDISIFKNYPLTVAEMNLITRMDKFYTGDLDYIAIITSRVYPIELLYKIFNHEIDLYTADKMIFEQKTPKMLIS